MLDTKISGGLVVDGSGGAPVRADVGVRGGRIVELGDLSGHAARETLVQDVVVGDVAEKDVLARIREAYGAIPASEIPEEDTLPEPPQLERLRVDVIEAGFAASSNGDFECVRAIAGDLRR